MAITFDTGFNDLTGLDSTAGSPTVQSVIVPNGSGPSALKCDAGAGATQTYVTKTLSGTMLVWQLRFYFSSSDPLGNGRIAQLQADTGGVYITLSSETDPKTLTMKGNDGVDKGVVTITTTLDAWHRITARVNIAANPWVIDWQHDGFTQTQSSPAITAGTLSNFDVGVLDTVPESTCYYDDWVLANNTADYPLVDFHIDATSVGLYAHRPGKRARGISW